MTIDPPPAADAPVLSRLEAHDRLRKKQEDVTYREPVSSPSNKLRDAGLIEHPGDLSLVVLPDSKTAQLIGAFEDKVGTRAAIETTSVVLMSIGGAITLIDLSLSAGGTFNESSSANGLGLIGLLVGVATLTTGVVLQVIASEMTGEISIARNAALDTYDDDLLQRLNLCKTPAEKGIVVAACP